MEAFLKSEQKAVSEASRSLKADVKLDSLSRQAVVAPAGAGLLGGHCGELQARSQGHVTLGRVTACSELGLLLLQKEDF